jgi:hypothetical protein
MAADGQSDNDFLHSPLSQKPWYPDVVAQSLEVLPIFLDHDGLGWLKPIHASSLRVGVGVNEQPATAVMKALRVYGLAPSVVHSTSWRMENERMILTYAAIVPHPVEHAYLEAKRIGRTALARGEATAAPIVVNIEQVIEHAVRHLAWLVSDDPVIAKELVSWRDVLAGFTPEPFRAFQAPSHS